MPKIKIGDIFEINTPNGKAYLHYIHEDPKIKRQLIRVFQGLYHARQIQAEHNGGWNHPDRVLHWYL